MVRHQLWLRQLRLPADLFGLLGLPRPSYGTNYPPYGILPGRFGMGIWRPGYVAPGYVYGASYYPSSGFGYRTFPVMYGREGRAMDPAPPMGYYAPAYGPGPDPRPAPVFGW